MSYTYLGPFRFKQSKKKPRSVRALQAAPYSPEEIATNNSQATKARADQNEARRAQSRKEKVIEQLAKSTLELQENGNEGPKADPSQTLNEIIDTPRLGANNSELRTYARRIAHQYGINPNLFEAQIQQESGFNPSSTSSAGAQGIAQIMPATAQAWGVDPSNPKAALKAAAAHMAEYTRKYKGNYNDALVAYNAGPGRVGKQLYGETRAYIDRINEMANQANAAAQGANVSSPSSLNPLKTGKALARKYGLRLTSGYRTPEHNAEVGGVSGSYHTRGTKENPGAVDLVGSPEAMSRAAASAKKRGYSTLIHDAGSGTHLHIENDGGTTPGTLTATDTGGSFSSDGLSSAPIPGTEDSSDSEEYEGPNLFEWLYNMNLAQGMEEDSLTQQNNLFLSAIMDRLRRR